MTEPPGVSLLRWVCAPWLIPRVRGVKRRVLTAESLRDRLAEYEARYGVSSERRHEPFTVDGELRETDDWRRWDALYGVWRRSFAPRTPLPASETEER